MNSRSDTHDRDYRELVFLHALRALPASEFPVVEAHISACVDCQQEVETLRPLIASFVSWPIDVLRPSASLWERVAQRIGAETGEELVEPAFSGEDLGASRRYRFRHPTASGKTIAAAGFVEAARTEGVLILTHRRLLVDQFRRELTEHGYGSRFHEIGRAHV